jgi:hypothetical protein
MLTKDAIWQQVLPLLPPGAATGCLASLPALGMDSLDFVKLVMHVEQHFGIRFSSAELEDLRTVQLLLSDTPRHLRRSLYAKFFAQFLHNSPWS